MLLYDSKTHNVDDYDDDDDDDNNNNDNNNINNSSVTRKRKSSYSLLLNHRELYDLQGRTIFKIRGGGGQYLL